MNKGYTNEGVYEDLVQILSELSGVRRERISKESHLYVDLSLEEENLMPRVLDILENRYSGFGLNSDNLNLGKLRTVSDLQKAVIGELELKYSQRR